MVKNLLSKSYNWFLFVILLPVMYGCNEGGSGTASLGSLFGPQDAATLASGASDPSTTLAVTAGVESAGHIGTITNPEPATMLLLGSGMMAMAYFKNRSK